MQNTKEDIEILRQLRSEKNPKHKKIHTKKD